MSEEFLKNMKLIYAWKKKIIRSGDRYLIYLSQALNEVWKYLHDKGVKVSVYLVVDEKS